MAALMQVYVSHLVVSEIHLHRGGVISLNLTCLCKSTNLASVKSNSNKSTFVWNGLKIPLYVDVGRHSVLIVYCIEWGKCQSLYVCMRVGVISLYVCMRVGVLCLTSI